MPNMIDLPFEMICKKGAIFHWNNYKFPDGETQNKFLIILNFNDKYILHILITNSSFAS